MKKRILSVVLTMSLAFSMIATSALAADGHVHDETCGYSDGQCVYGLCETGEDENLIGAGTEGETESICTVTENCTLDAGHEGECVVNVMKDNEDENDPASETEMEAVENVENSCTVTEG